MRIGPLRHRIELQAPQASQDAYGQPLVTWQTQQSVWASVEPISGKEYFGAQQVQSDLTTKIRLRWRPDFTPTTKWRVIYLTQIYDIESVIDIYERDREWHLMCIQRNQDGVRD